MLLESSHYSHTPATNSLSCSCSLNKFSVAMFHILSFSARIRSSFSFLISISIIKEFMFSHKVLIWYDFTILTNTSVTSIQELTTKTWTFPFHPYIKNSCHRHQLSHEAQTPQQLDRASVAIYSLDVLAFNFLSQERPRADLSPLPLFQSYAT